MNDRWLELMTVLACNAGQGQEPSVTLMVNGILVTGKIISPRRYVEQDPIMAVLLAQAQDMDHDTNALIGEDADQPPYEFIHLADAQYFTGDGRPIPTEEGVFCRIKVDHISGYHFGRLEAARFDLTGQ